MVCTDFLKDRIKIICRVGYERMKNEDEQPKKKTYVSLLQELCVKFGFGNPMYDLKEQHGDAHEKTFTIELYLPCMELRSIIGAILQFYKLLLG